MFPAKVSRLLRQIVKFFFKFNTNFRKILRKFGKTMFTKFVEIRLFSCLTLEIERKRPRNQISAVPSRTKWQTQQEEKYFFYHPKMNNHCWQLTSYWRLKTNYRNKTSHTGSARRIFLPTN